MKLVMLYKDPSSGTGGCPSVYLADNGDLVVQGHILDADTEGNLHNVLPGEAAVRISADVVQGALAAYSARAEL